MTSKPTDPMSESESVAISYRLDCRWQALQERYVRDWDRETESSEDAFLRRIDAAKAMAVIELEYEGEPK